jgi:hypothetical protein
MLAGFLESIVPRQVVLLGQKLNQYSLGHNILLNFFRNGFVSADDPSDSRRGSRGPRRKRAGLEDLFGDLLSGVFFCTHSWVENVAAMGSGSMVKALEEFAARLGSEQSFDLKKAIAGFQEYLVLGSGLPEVLPPDGDGRKMGSPFDLRLLIFLIKELKLTHVQALDFPYGLGRHLIFGFYEMEGRAKVANPEEREQLKQLEDAAESEEVLAACLKALPGSVALTDEEQRDAAPKEKKKGALRGRRQRDVASRKKVKVGRRGRGKR